MTPYTEVPADLHALLPQLSHLADNVGFEVNGSGVLLCYLSWVGDAPGDDPMDTTNDARVEAQQIVGPAGWEIGDCHVEHDYASFYILGKNTESFEIKEGNTLCADNMLLFQEGNGPLFLNLTAFGLTARIAGINEIEVSSTNSAFALRLKGIETPGELIPLADYNGWRSAVYNAADLDKPRPNGIGCPECGKELWDNDPTMILISDPPQKNVHCPACGYRGTRLA